MKCATCDKEIKDGSISAADRDFCSDICHLHFWKDEMPNLGWNFISDEILQKLEQLTGQNRKDQYNEIVNFILNNFDDTSFMFKLRYKDDPNEED